MPSDPQVPEYRQYFNPMLRALKALGGSASIDELTTQVAHDMKLSDAVLGVPHDPEHGERSEVAYRIAWARTYLKAAGLITNSERGVWSLTPEGTRVDHVDEKKLAREVQLQRRGYGRKRRQQETDEPEAGNDAGETDWKHELAEVLHEMKPDAFERLCQRVLREIGFVEVRVTGRTGDGGIDGVGLLRLQEVITFPVIFQCKRWRRRVDPATVREFRGAMHGRTDKGLILTTSYFTPEAIREASREGAAPVDLIGGDQLVELLHRLKLGVKTEMVERVTVEREWFESV